MLYNLVIIGGGPAGLSAAINGASELDNVLLIESGRKTRFTDGSVKYERVLGGQAIGSAAIENYLGFPEGITGAQLMSLAEKQASRLGTEIVCPKHAKSLELLRDGTKLVRTKEGGEYRTKAVILANGLSYRKLDAPGIKELLNRGVQYGAPTTNPHQMGKCTICVVGGANSAGQAIMHLSQNEDAKVKVLIRGTKPIESQMSKYLVDRVHAAPNVEVMQGFSVVEASGNGKLECLTLEDVQGTRSALKADHLCIFIGAQPKVEWLSPEIVRDQRGFIGTDVALDTSHGPKLPQETSMSGVFAAGDILLGSTKRIAAGVGGGSSAVQSLHRYLAEAKLPCS
ncbi:FAD-dependent oxidoreductase [Candidatus Kaiserbacteria bacterium]|nr:FAD-dependent oxidoreductase [Candidatus Kaiserbacteria bacterium]MCB9811331.1 FAD-dependent oxidoreductase [Candidatus Nomurabacteria bacterium]